MMTDPQQPYCMHVIPNTHWDREWIYGFQETRFMLVELIDGLLEMLAAVPDYTYVLDAQVVPLEDYLVMRPEKRDEIERFVANGQLEIGPWYSALETVIANGESIVRNMLIGHRVCREFGGQPMKIGYTPFSFGQPSQMPQIYRGFGIDTMLFYRGVGSWNTKHAEFIWEGPDGSRLLASRLGSMGRYNFYMKVWRPVAYDMTVRERNYYWEMEGLPFHLCNNQDKHSHYYLLDPQTQYRRDKLVSLIEELRDVEKTHFATRHLAFMHGMDSTAPDPIEFDILADAQRKIADSEIFFSSMTRFMEGVQAEIDQDALEVKYGERRHPGTGPMAHLMGDVLSSRMPLKIRNTQVELALQRWAEPYAAIAAQLGASYPTRALDLAWKDLLVNQAHDSAGGCGVDQIEKDMQYRFDQAQGIADGLLRRSLQAIQLQIDNADLDARDIALTIFNPSPYPRTEVITATLDIDARLEYKDFTLYRDGETVVPYHLVNRTQREMQVVRHLTDVTLALTGDRATIQFLAEEIPALGYRTYVVRSQGVRHCTPASLVTGPYQLDNDHVRCRFAHDGTVEMTDKRTRHVFANLHYFEDSGEGGMAWQYLAPPQDRIVSSLGRPATIAVVENTPLQATIRVDYHLQIPADMVWSAHTQAVSDFSVGWPPERRSDELVDMTITSFFTLRADGRALDVRTIFDNQARCHRLRVMFPTNIPAAVSHAESAFDVAYRTIDRGPEHPHYETPNPTYPQGRFVDVSDGAVGLAILNMGLREYEVSDDASRTVAVTLLRAYQMSLCTVTFHWEVHPEQQLTQCFGPQERRYAIYPHAGDWATGNVFTEVECFTLPLKIAQVGRHGGNLPKQMSFLEVDPPALILSAMKQAEDGQALIVRLFNPTTSAVQGCLKVPRTLRAATMLTLEELPQHDIALADSRVVPLTVQKKQIVTLRLSFA